MERGVRAIARVDERLGDMEQMRRQPERDLAHRPACPQVGERKSGDDHQPADDLRGEGIQREIHEAETEGRPSRRMPLSCQRSVLDNRRSAFRGHPVWIV